MVRTAVRFLEMSFPWTTGFDMEETVGGSFPLCSIWGKIGIDFFRVVKVTSILELMQRQAGTLVGPIQSHRLATREHFSTSLGKTKTGYKDWNQWMETGRVQQSFHEVSLLTPTGPPKLKLVCWQTEYQAATKILTWTWASLFFQFQDFVKLLLLLVFSVIPRMILRTSRLQSSQPWIRYDPWSVVFCPCPLWEYIDLQKRSWNVRWNCLSGCIDNWNVTRHQVDMVDKHWVMRPCWNWQNVRHLAHFSWHLSQIHGWHFRGPIHLGNPLVLNLWVPRKIPPTIQGPEMPKSVEEAERQGRFAWKGRWNMLSFFQDNAELFHNHLANEGRNEFGLTTFGSLLAPNKVDWEGICFYMSLCSRLHLPELGPPIFFVRLIKSTFGEVSALKARTTQIPRVGSEKSFNAIRMQTENHYAISISQKVIFQF